MVKLYNFHIILVAVVKCTVALEWRPGPPTCECFNYVYVDTPNKIDECSRVNFLNQINSNYNNIHFALVLNNYPFQCNFDTYRKRIKEMKNRTVQLVDTFFSCTKTDCKKDVMRAYQNFVKYKLEEFNPFTRCAYTNYNRNCAQILVEPRSAVYSSAENILVALLACSKLKSATNCGSQPTSSQQFVNKNKETECNCVKIDPAPIPRDQSECFSAEYITDLRAFIEINFKRVFDEYSTNNGRCDYEAFYGYAEQMKNNSLASTELLGKSNPKMAELEDYYKQHSSVFVEFSAAVQEYILTEDKSCYFNIRKARCPPAITDAVLGILTKCIGYFDKSQDLCSKFLK